MGSKIMGEDESVADCEEQEVIGRYNSRIRSDEELDNIISGMQAKIHEEYIKFEPDKEYHTNELLSKLRKVFGSSLQIDEKMASNITHDEFSPAFRMFLKSQIESCNIVYDNEKWFKGVRTTISIPIKINLEFKFDVFFSELEEILKTHINKSDNVQDIIDKIIKLVTNMVRVGISEGNLMDYSSESLDLIKSKLGTDIVKIIDSDITNVSSNNINNDSNLSNTDEKVNNAYNKNTCKSPFTWDEYVEKSKLYEDILQKIYQSRNIHNYSIDSSKKNNGIDPSRKLNEPNRNDDVDFLDVKLVLIGARLSEYSKPHNANVILELTNCLQTNSNDIEKKNETIVKQKIYETIVKNKLQVNRREHNTPLFKKPPGLMSSFFHESSYPRLYNDKSIANSSNDSLPDKFEYSTFLQKISMVNNTCTTIAKLNRTSDLAPKYQYNKRGHTSDYNQYFENLKRKKILVAGNSILIGAFINDDEIFTKSHICGFESNHIRQNPWNFDTSKLFGENNFYDDKIGRLKIMGGRSNIPSILPLGMKCETMTSGRFVRDPNVIKETNQSMKESEQFAKHVCASIFENFDVFFEEDACVALSRLGRSGNANYENVELSVGALSSNIRSGISTFDIDIDESEKNARQTLKKLNPNDPILVKKIVAMKKSECRRMRDEMCVKKYDDLILMDLKQMNIKISLELMDDFENIIKLYLKGYLDDVIFPSYDDDKNTIGKIENIGELEQLEKSKIGGRLLSFFERYASQIFKFDNIDMRVDFDTIIYHDLLETSSK